MIAVPNYISTDEYLTLERQSPIRHEYRRGLVYAMAGSTDNHNRIAFNLLKLIDNHLGNASDCRFYSGNVKVNCRVSPSHPRQWLGNRGLSGGRCAERSRRRSRYAHQHWARL
jgi:Uma2 family endonuclease